MSDLTTPKKEFPRLFDRLPELTDAEREREAHARYCRSLPAHATPMSFDRWKLARRARLNREGQNHD